MEHIGYNEVEYGAVTVLAATNQGFYPYGNSVVIRGADSTLIVDPSLALDTAPCAVDAVMISHAHEDHLAGLSRFDAPVYAHEADAPAVRSRQALMDGYGLPDDARTAFAKTVHDEFGVRERPDALAVADGHRFDLGGRSVTVVHLPGHTAGHCGLLVEPEGFFYVSDIDLTSFGPFYGDLGSSLTDFERAMETCASIEARWYGTFHQKGVIEGSEEFRKRLAHYRSVIDVRDQRVLEILTEPKSIEQIVEQRIVYRPHVDEPYVDTVERHTARCHVARLVERGAIVQTQPGLYQTTK